MPKVTRNSLIKRRVKFREMYPEIFQAHQELKTTPELAGRACGVIYRQYQMDPFDRPWYELTDREVASMDGCGRACAKLIKRAQDIHNDEEQTLKYGYEIYQAMKGFDLLDKFCIGVSENPDELCFVIDEDEITKLIGYLSVRMLRMTYVTVDKVTGRRTQCKKNPSSCQG